MAVRDIPELEKQPLPASSSTAISAADTAACLAPGRVRSGRESGDCDLRARLRLAGEGDLTSLALLRDQPPQRQRGREQGERGEGIEPRDVRVEPVRHD